MKRFAMVMALLSLLALAGIPAAGAAETKQSGTPSDVLVIAGTVTNAHGKPVKEAEIVVLVNGKRVEVEEAITTGLSGRFEAEIALAKGSLANSRVEVGVERHAYRNLSPIAIERMNESNVDEKGNTIYLAHQSFTMEREITPAFWIATIILVAVYALIALEVLHRTLAALLGASLMLAITYIVGTFSPGWAVLTFEDAMRAIDMNVILLLMAMMIIVGVLKKTGVFQWMAFKAYQAARGNIYALSGILMVVTAVASAFLDNVTTMLLVIPVTIEIALTLKVNPVAFLLPEVFASNVGGTATLIGDPPNIMIGSYAKLSFVDFVQNLTVICFISLAVTAVYFIYWYKKEYLKAQVGDVQSLIAHLREEYRITDKKLLIQGGIVLGVTILLFILHGALHMEPSIAALIGAAVLLVVSKVDIVEMLEHEIEWPTLVFFIMLFIVVAGAEETGLIQVIADWVNNMSQGSLTVAVLLILWVSAVASALIDNIPFTATMLPIVAYLTTTIPGAQGGVLWWALALGACLGGNGTMIGASANVVTVGMAERFGHPISFMEYLKVAAVPTFITIVLCSFWLLLVEM